MSRILRNESGFALATAILALIVVGALVTAGFFASSQEARMGTSNAQADIAFYIAEQGLQNTLGTVTRTTMAGVAVGSSLTRTGTVSIGSRQVGTYVASVRPFGNNLFWIESVGTVTEGGRYAGATRRLGTVVRTLTLNFPINGALTTYGGITLRGSADVSGHDSRPSNWPAGMCPPMADSEAGIYTRPEANVELKGGPRVEGSPPVQTDPNLMPEDFEDFGDLDFDGFRSIATWVLTGEVSPAASYTNGGSVCNTSDPDNWGAPTRPTSDPCFSHFPIIFYDGNLSIRGNSTGQGILFVNGDFSVGGGFEFYGIVIVRGIFNNSGSGNAEIHGALMTKNNADIYDDSEFRGNPTLQYSRCSIDRSINNNPALTRLFPVQQRSWVDLTGAGVEG